jgi:uncharacterized membrane protein
MATPPEHPAPEPGAAPRSGPPPPPSPRPHRDHERERGRQLDRVNAFSDGVFSIAATLLVLSIDIPNGSGADLAHDLRDLERPLLAYFISFAVVGIYWYHHHRMLGRLRASDQGFAVLNLVFLSFVALLPAPTQLLARYEDQTAPVVIYALNVLILAGLSKALARYADRNGLTDAPIAEDDEGVLASWAVFIAFGLSIPVAFVSPDNATYVWLLSAILPIGEGLVRRRRPAPTARA